MIVADSSYIVEGLLKDASLLENELIIAPDIALYEVANSIWKHESVLKDIKDGEQYIDLLFELASSGALQFVRPNEKVVKQAYGLALKRRCAFYDAIFAALALELGLALKTFNERQRGFL